MCAGFVAHLLEPSSRLHQLPSDFHLLVPTQKPLNLPSPFKLVAIAGPNLKRMDALDILRLPRRFLQIVNELEPALYLVDLPQPEPESVSMRKELRSSEELFSKGRGGGQDPGPVTVKLASIVIEEDIVLQFHATASHHARDLVFNGSENTA